MAKKYSISETLQPLVGLVFVFKKIADRTLRSKLSTTTAQFKIMLAVQHDPSLSQRAIAEFWGVTEASASRQIDILNKKGLISKAQDPNNHRKYILKLTKRGHLEIKKTSRLMSEIFERIFRGVSNQDRETFHNLSKRFIAIIKDDDLLQIKNINKCKK